jgi:hypothetical protein
LEIRVTPTGVKTFSYAYKTVDGKRERYTIGKYGKFTPEQVIKKVKLLAGKVAAGENPQADKRRTRHSAGTPTLDDVITNSYEEWGRPFYALSDILTVPEPTDISIDIKPGSNKNNINPRNQGIVRVAILTTDNFDAVNVDTSTVKLKDASALQTFVHFRDVDHDGDADLVLHFRTQDTGIACGETEALLTGMTLDGDTFEGVDSIKTVGCK